MKSFHLIPLLLVLPTIEAFTANNVRITAHKMPKIRRRTSSEQTPRMAISSPPKDDKRQPSVRSNHVLGTSTIPNTSIDRTSTHPLLGRTIMRRLLAFPSAVKRELELTYDIMAANLLATVILGSACMTDFCLAQAPQLSFHS